MKSIVLNKIQLQAYWPRQLCLYYLQQQKKNTKAIRLRIKCTITKVIKFDDNNLRRKLIFMKLKSKIQRYSYLPRINLCELFNEAKQRLSMQSEPFYYFTVLRNYPFLRSFYSYG